MGSNKERIENLEATLGEMQNEMQKMNLGVADKFRGIEDSLNRLMEVVTNNKDVVKNPQGSVRRSEGNNQHKTMDRAENVHTNPFYQARSVKLEFPRFRGGDPTSWISKVKQYFSYQDTPMEQQVQYASYHLEDEANEWWQATSKALGEDQTEVTWTVFEEEMWARFGPTEADNFDEALSKIQQTGTLREYQREFERLHNKVDGWTQKALVGTYMGGLNPNIADPIRMFKPKSLKDVIGLARMRDDQLQKQKRGSGFSNATPQSFMTTRDSSIATPKKLSWEEIKRKRSLGLCFSCDERYTPGHKCRESQLLIMEGENEVDDSQLAFRKAETPMISLYALTGWNAPETLRIYATVNKQDVVALVDSGSTHNFISEKAAKKLNLEMIRTSPFAVRVANGSPLQCHGHYKDVQVKMGEVTISVTLNALPLVGLDLVLGIEWLRTLGPIICDWKAQTMEFNWEGKRCTLEGIRNTSIQSINASEFAKEVRQGHEVFAVYVTNEGVEILPTEGNTETTTHLQFNFPKNFTNLEDKVLLEDGNIDELRSGEGEDQHGLVGGLKEVDNKKSSTNVTEPTKRLID